VKNLNRLISLFALLLAGASTQLHAEEIYRWTDANGRVHYSSNQQTEAAATLPTIQRENLDQKIASIRQNISPSCSTRGGIDCTRGSDDDGSVICVDGFRDASTRFANHCREAKLALKSSLVTDSKGVERGDFKELSQILEKRSDNLPLAIQFFIRNSSGVRAEEMKVEVIVPGEERFDALGPSDIEPFGAAEYTLGLETVMQRYPLQSLKRLKVRAGCANCRALIAVNSD
jgi:hypothetical protein